MTQVFEFGYEELKSEMRKGMRNGNWRRLNTPEKGFLRAAMWYARVKGKIVSSLVVVMLVDIIEKLRETIKDKIFHAGLAKAEEMLSSYKQVFNWAPQLKEWLCDPDYVFWLGTCKQKHGTFYCRCESILQSVVGGNE